MTELKLNGMGFGKVTGQDGKEYVCYEIMGRYYFEVKNYYCKGFHMGHLKEGKRLSTINKAAKVYGIVIIA